MSDDNERPDLVLMSDDEDDELCAAKYSDRSQHQQPANRCAVCSSPLGHEFFLDSPNTSPSVPPSMPQEREVSPACAQSSAAQSNATLGIAAEGGVQLSPQNQRTQVSSSMSAGGDGRGRYDRSGGKGIREPWLPYVKKHVNAANEGNLSMFMSTCCKDCPNDRKCFDTVCLRTIKNCLAVSFGDEALCLNEQGEFRNPGMVVKNHSAGSAWFDLAKTGRSFDADGKVSNISFKVEEREVCFNAWARMHAIPPSTAEKIHYCLKDGNAIWNDGTVSTATTVMSAMYIGAHALIFPPVDP